MSGRFAKQVVVVTGSSRGIGLAVAEAFARQGATVVGVARSASDNPTIKHIPLDLATADGEKLTALVADVVARHGRIDVLVNNAGIIRRSPAVSFSESDWNDVIRINLTVPFLLSQATASWWFKSGRAKAPATDRLRIVNIASLLSFQGGILVPAYTASKHGIAGVTKALANEWASQRVNVNAVAPGYVETENTLALREDPDRSQAILSRIPQGVWARPDDIAGACLYLSSPDADYVNGTILNVDGGWLAR